LATNSVKGITYRWKCPEIFQDYCDEWIGSPILVISSDAFKAYGGEEFLSYTFTVETYSLMIGGPPSSDAQIFSKSTSIQWAKVQKPDFTIKGDDTALVTQRNEF
jgi:hypothetical protein